MAEGFTKKALKMVVSQVCQTIGWHAIQTSSLEVLIDVLHRYLEEIARTSHLYADQFGRTRPNLDDLGLAFSAMGVEIKQLEEYIEYVESVPCNYQVPKYPVAKESHLNFLKPGSKEVVTRPVHVHEHLPPTILEEQGYSQNENVLSVETSGSSSIPSPQASPQNVFKRPGDPVETPAAKRARLFLEEEGRPLREISSVMMTTGGFLSPAREGKLPESKVILPTSDSRSISPQPSLYPSVPPEVNREKKVKKIPEVSKAEKKEKKKISEKLDNNEEPAIKKLASMKEMEKLKALKTGALKMSARYPPNFQEKLPKPGSNKIPPVENTPSEKSLIQKLSESPHLVVTPLQPTVKKQTSSNYEKSRDSGVTIAKLTTEPDVQKLNIFKKITKVKEEKSEKVEKHEFSDIVPPVNKERSPGLIIEEVVPSRKPRSALSEMMESLPKDKKEARQPKPEPRTPDILQIYDDSLSSPGSPSTPKTPEIMRKIDKSPEHKKKKKDKEKEKKKRKGSPKDRIKTEDDLERNERPKTPEILEPSRLKDALPSPVLPFFPHFPSGPGLIPPPITNPLIPRFPHPLCPNFPNLPLPPPLLMQQPIKTEEMKKDPFKRMFERSTSESLSPTKFEKEGKSPLAILLNRGDKEKKFKEHKKDKKDRDKIKKKKDKKEKMKKDKSEKKHRDKDDKYKEQKSKEKKEKKIKKKEKMKESSIPMVVSVPKLTLKLGSSSPRPSSPDPKLKKLLSKPSKMEGEDKTMQPTKREPTPEIARISSLFNKPPKSSDTKPLHIQTDSFKTQTTTLTVKESVPVMKSPGTIIDKDGNKVWICPACGRPDDGSAMIGCDECDAWYHWVCVGIQVPPDKNEDWYCRFCIVKKQGSQTEKKKRGRKKKPPA